jgi:thymidylate synthase
MNYAHEDGTPFTKEEFIQKLKTDKEFNDEFGNKGIDQIANLTNELKTNPDSRRLMVSAWNVGELDQMTLPPCHYGFQVYTRELSARERTSIGSKGSTRLYDSIKEANYETIDADVEMHKVCDEANVPRRAISLMWNQRSVDTPLGLPFNIASYGLLLEIIAKEVNMVPDELIGNLGDAHIYLNQIEGVKEQIGRTPYELPKINFNTEWWDEPFFKAVYSESFCKCLLEEDIQLYKYQSHPAIKMPLSN